jgi:Uma2 family endonuclease
MTQAGRKLTFEEYASLNAEDWIRLGLPEGRCEYGDGELVELPSESELNDWIAQELFWLLAISQIVSRRLIRPHSCEIEVPGKPRTRFPDLVILREEHLSLTQKRLLITLKMPPPQLVAEVISPGHDNHRRDDEAKRKQYQDRGIPEYWLINPENQSITVLELQNGQYVEFGIFRSNNVIQSPLFKGLNLMANQLFATAR